MEKTKIRDPCAGMARSRRAPPQPRGPSRAAWRWRPPAAWPPLSYPSRWSGGKELAMGKNGLPGLIDVSTRSKRRRAASLASSILEHVRRAELASMGRVPPSLRGGAKYSDAEYSAKRVAAAISNLLGAYDPIPF